MVIHEARPKPGACWPRASVGGRDVREPYEYRLLCGNPRCRTPRPGAGLGRLDCRDWDGDRRMRLYLAPGLIQTAPGVFQLGTHAAARHDHTPRHPRASGASADGRAYRSRDGQLLLGDGAPIAELLQERRDVAGLLGRDLMAYAYQPYELVSLGDAITISCTSCRQFSTFIVRPSLQILEDILARKRAGQAGNRSLS